MRLRVAGFAAFISVASISAASAAAPPNATVVQPRAFGYVIGDVATQRVLLEQQGRAFTPASLPAPGPLGNWVERRASRVEVDTRGREWLAIEYQIMNSPQRLMAVTLPAWKLAAKSSNTELLVPEWQISVGPLTPEQPFARAGLGALRPDRAASPIDVASIQRWVAVWTVAAAVLLFTWAGWWAWRNWQASSKRPFARALRELRGIDEQSPDAWYAMHRALDATAGRVVQRETVSALFERVPQLAPQRAAIEQFLDASMARFFGTSAQKADAASARTDGGVGRAAASALSLRSLCAELRRIEKRHET